MRKNLPVTQTEYSLEAHGDLISATDEKGRIRYANDDFVTVSGFGCEELEHSPHNIVRHPDMPEAAYVNMWETLKADHPWMGIVKNRRKDGDHYWVDAFVTPAYEHGRKTGYESVRAIPEREHVARAEQVYAALNRGRSFARRWYHGLTWRLAGTWIAGFLLALAAVSLAPPPLVLAGLLALVFVAGGVVSLALTSGIRQAVNRAREQFDNPVMEAIYTGRRDDSASLELIQHFNEAKLRTVLGRIEDKADAVAGDAQAMASSVDQTASGVERQQNEIDQVATAMNEMSSTIQEMAGNSARAAEAANHAEKETGAGQEVVNDTVAVINRMAAEVESTAEKLGKLEASTEEIDKILGVIREIAEQTNLLALNAAIEAARAGEHGRGFAVVADEVRSLSQRTDESTVTIRNMIESLQNGAREAMSAMRASQEQAADGVEKARAAGDSLTTIREAVAQITEMNTQIATAVEEQSAVSEEINRNVTSIRDVASETGSVSAHARAASARMLAEAAELKALIQRFEQKTG
ncbi:MULTISPECIES: PAS domain-containing methyl-accepting chemotaxis protein [unclassified Thioalkalivibrio]|uniref:methyl-accepting chemotaxis protein n=1 Tax=unclassified Thioalkalivibrio TaxID=2621013 RepID=UPI00037C2055|nr:MULTISPECIES: PAS domain-containing methyl-accepting chemotaxis protein [unclassified Thioalkalivibrio]